MKISLFGYGNTNKEVALRIGNCDIFDDKFKEVSLDEYGNRLLPSHLFDPTESSLEIVTPGIPPSHPLVLAANGVISDYDLFARDFPFSIWISGTNGKTTTTQMVQHLLASRGSVEGGNIGSAVASLDRDAPIWILETSSFTLHYTNIAAPNIYLLLPIEQDHISWHGSFEEYERAKLKPLAKLAEGEMAVVPAKYKDYPTRGFLIPYESSEDLAEYFDIDITKIEQKEPFLLDALLALSVTKALYDEVDYELINAFQAGAHKIEEFVDFQNRLWVDDSKATNVTATIEAIKRYRDKKIYLILGGDDKGADMEPLFVFLRDFNIKIFTIGTNSVKLATLAQKHHIDFHEGLYLKDAVAKIREEFEEGVALLSPAAASLDQFSSYKERGEKFKLYVNNN